MPHQVAWILGEEGLHAQKKPVFALAEKSVRIGWTYADAFKNVRKRLRFPKRDYLFATKDYQSALEYMTQAHAFARLLNFTRAIVAHGEDYLKVNRLDPEGRPTAFTEEIKISYIKFDNGSRIIAFSASPQAMAVYGGDVGLDEFAKHPSAKLLWQTAQGRVTWGHDMAVWSAHEGEDTLFNQFAQQARAACSAGIPACGFSGHPCPESKSGNPQPAICNLQSEFPQSPWNLYYRVTITDAIDLGLLEVINRTRGTELTRDQFIADCQARAGLDEIFQQTYMCNPIPGAAGIVDWSAIERCRSQDYEIERLHLEARDVLAHFGQPSHSHESAREQKITQFLRDKFPILFPSSSNAQPTTHYRLGFDIAASGQGDLAAFYIDEPNGPELWLRALLTVRTEDWHFLKIVLFFLLKNLPRIHAAGDETGLGRQICWEATKQFSSRFLPVNFAQKKHDLGFALMNQLSAGEKRFPKNQQDIAADYFALRKMFTGTKWIFGEGRNSCNPLSHCDIAWAGALATYAHHQRPAGIRATVDLGHGSIDPSDPHANYKRLIFSDDPSIWRSL